MTAVLTPFEICLPTGETLTIREIRQGDRALIAEGFDAMSERSRHLRFLGAHPRMSASELDRFAELNDADHYTVGAISDADTDGVLPVGSARYVRDPKDATRAEFAVTIVDSHQGRGIGSLLITVLADHARRNGIDTLIGFVSPDNAAMRGLLSRMGARPINTGPSEIEITLPVAGACGYRGRLQAQPQFTQA